jgi:hypothetical protein
MAVFDAFVGVYSEIAAFVVAGSVVSGFVVSGFVVVSGFTVLTGFAVQVRGRKIAEMAITAKPNITTAAGAPLRNTDASVDVVTISSSTIGIGERSLKVVIDLRRGLRMAAGRFTLPGGMDGVPCKLRLFFTN